MANKLTNLKLTSVDLVRAGANQEADICIYKSATPQDGDNTASEHEKNIFKRFINWLRENPSDGENEPSNTIEKDFSSFDTLNSNRENEEKLWRYTSSLTESIRTIMNDNELDSTQKLEYMKKSLGQFDAAMVKLFGDLCTMEPAKQNTRDAVVKSENRYDVIEEVKKFNPYHGKDGRFTSASGGGVASFTIRTKDPAKQHLADNAIAREVQRNTDIAVNGPGQTKAFVDSYVKEHPEIAEEAKKYANVLENVQNFQKNNPNAEAGTYSAVTGELVNPSSGYAVTFHQNKTADNPYGAYDSDTYAKMCAITKKETGSSDVYIGYFGNAEVSFNCPTIGRAMEFAVKHNQHSIYDCSRDRVIVNTEKYNKSTNPIEGY